MFRTSIALLDTLHIHVLNIPDPVIVCFHGPFLLELLLSCPVQLKLLLSCPAQLELLLSCQNPPVLPATAVLYPFKMPPHIIFLYRYRQSSLTVTHNFVRGSQKKEKNVGASCLKKGILYQKLLSLKYFWKCQKKLKIVVTVCFVPFSLCWFEPVEFRYQK